MNSLVFSNLSGGYLNKIVFSKITASISAGSFTAITGPNGSGKSTLLKHIIKELEPQEGSISVLNSDISKLSQKLLAKKLSFVGQNSHVDYDFTVSQIVGMGQFAHEVYSEKDIYDALCKVGIERLTDKLITELSGGEVQLVMLARAICQNTEVILLDEPVNNLDPKHQLILMSLLRKMADEGKTIVCVLHDLNSILTWCDRCLLLKDGKIVADGPVKEVITEKNVLECYQVSCKINQVDGQEFLTYCCNS